MEKLKQDIYNYFLPKSDSPQTAITVTYTIMDMVQNHLSEYTDTMERLLSLVAELNSANTALQNRVQDAEELLVNSTRLAYDAIVAASELRVGEQRLDTLEEFHKEL
jgi:hypothetical protein